MISTFQRNGHFREVSVNKLFTHVQEHKQSDVAAKLRLHSVKCKIALTEDNPNEKIFKKQPPVMLYKKSVLDYLAIYIRKHLCQSLFFDKVAWGLQLY